MNKDEARLPKTWSAFFQQQNFTPVIIKSIERIHDSSWSMTPNSHDHFEMLYMKRGSSIFTVSGDDVHLEANSMIIIRPGQMHKFAVKSEDNCEFIVLSFNFESKYGEDSAPIAPEDFIEFVDTDNAGAYIHVRLPRKNEIASVLENILRERDRRQMWDGLMVQLLLMQLFVLISRTLKNEWEQNIKSRSWKIKEVIRTAKDYIDANYSRSITLSDVAQYVFLSESYLAHVFKNEFGISPKSYLLKARIDASCELLTATDMKISDVALSVGFSNPQRYNDMFKKYMHTTPLKYRRLQKINRLNVED